MFLALAAAFFAVFIGNVFYSSTGGVSPFSGVGELWLLIGASVSFVVAILRAEARQANRRS